MVSVPTMVGNSATAEPGRGARSAAGTCGEAIVRLLEQYGVDTVFGIPGVHTLEVYRGLSGSTIRHVLARHEQGAGFMADGYGRVRGEPGVCLVISGPGVTNVLTPVAQAYHDSRPLLVLSGAVSTADRGRDRGALHDLPDQRALMAQVTAFSHTVADPRELPSVFARAWEVFTCSRPPQPKGALTRADIARSQPANPSPASIALPGDSTAPLDAITAALPRDNAQPDRLARAAGRAKAPTACVRFPPEITDYQDFVDALDAALPDERIIVGDSTQPVYAANHLMPATQPRSGIISIRYGTHAYA